MNKYELTLSNDDKIEMSSNSSIYDFTKDLTKHKAQIINETKVFLLSSVVFIEDITYRDEVNKL